MIEVLMDKYNVSNIIVQCPRCAGEFPLKHIYLFPLIEKFEDEEEASLRITPPVLLVKQKALYMSTSVKGVPEDYYFVKCPLCDTPILDGFDVPSNIDQHLSFKGIEEDKKPQKAKKKKTVSAEKVMELYAPVVYGYPGIDSSTTSTYTWSTGSNNDSG